MTKPNFKRIFRVAFFTIFVIASLIVIANQMDSELSGGYDDSNITSGTVDESVGEDGYCPIMGIELHGELLTYDSSVESTEVESASDTAVADTIVWYIKDADKNEKVSGLVLEIDSGGGSPVAGEEIANALKTAKKPTVVIIRGVGASAAYWAATGADYIIASTLSDIGSIGITLSYLDYTKQNEKDGITYVELNSAKYKNAGDPDRPITEEEKALWQRDLDIMHNYFVKAIAENRKLDIEKVKQLADGSSMLGAMALENGLIDKIGGQTDAMQYFIDNKVITEPQEVCWY
jgi:protease-4